MFTGIVETTGRVIEMCDEGGCKHIAIRADLSLENHIGDSVSVNGVCLTVTHFSDNVMRFSVVPETLSVTTLKNIVQNSAVNVARAATFQDRIGGHYVQGHVDCVGKITDIQKAGDEALLVTIAHPHEFSKYIVNKGFIALDGMSITVIEIQDTQFKVTFIPHTQAITIVNQYRPGMHINIEVDILGKYVAHLLEASHANS